jgi:mono/diheme cytochrome c family protein
VGPNLSKTFSGIDVNAALKQTISNGVSGSPMPAWSQANGGPLSEQDIDDIIAYINTWGGGNAPPAPAPTPVPVTPQAVAGVTGDATRGAKLFAENCAGCHGARAEGRIGARLQKDWPGIRPELAIRQTIANGVPGAVMPAWSQANGGPLSEQDINDITLFILSLEPQAQPQPTPTPTGGISGTTAFIILVAAVVVLIGGMLIFRPGRRS